MWLQRWRVPAGGGGPASHLCLDGGRLLVKDADHADFLNAYAAAVVRGVVPCVVETRTPVFRFFVDVDAKVPDPVAFDVRGVCLAIAAAVDAAVSPPPACVVCAPSEPSEAKVGVHLHFPAVTVTPSTALWLRGRIVDAMGGPALDSADGPALDSADGPALDSADGPALDSAGGPALDSAGGPALDSAGGPALDWARVIDAAVYRGSGLRLPWSGKRAGDTRVYAPTARIVGGVWTDVSPVVGVAATRAWVHELSVRDFGGVASLQSPRGDGDGGDDADDDGGGARVCPESMTAYADVLPLVDAVLPVQHAGQRFVGVVSLGDSASARRDSDQRIFMLRSTSRWCGNIGRAHNSNNVYFQLTRAGVCQRCYCRCDTTEGRRHGLCKDYSSAVWQVPDRVTDAFFGPVLSPPPAPPPPRPGRVSTATMALVERGFRKRRK
jgi:hypothetical protein